MSGSGRVGLRLVRRTGGRSGRCGTAARLAIVNSPITIARVRNEPASAATRMFGRITCTIVVGQLAPRLCDASVSVCTSIARKPASSAKYMYGNARITYAADEEAAGLARRTRTASPCRRSSSPTTSTIGGTTNGIRAQERDHRPQLRQLQVHPVDRRHEEEQADHDRLEREQERDLQRVPELRRRG